jgi:hypothetical protein
MPLVIPRSGEVEYVRGEEVLAEILGRPNFDNHPWAVGDRIVFEDGTEAKIRREPGQPFHGWGEPVPANLHEVRRAAAAPGAEGWSELFAAVAAREPRPRAASVRSKAIAFGCLIGCVLLFALPSFAALWALTDWPLWHRTAISAAGGLLLFLLWAKAHQANGFD